MSAIECIHEILVSNKSHNNLLSLERFLMLSAGSMNRLRWTIFDNEITSSTSQMPLRKPYLKLSFGKIKQSEPVNMIFHL